MSALWSKGEMESMESLLRPERAGSALSRRGFLKWSSGLVLGVTAAGLLAACGSDDEDPTATSAAAAGTATSPMMDATATESMMAGSTATGAMMAPTATEAMMADSTATEAMMAPTEGMMETVVEIALTEWAVTPSVSEAPAGMITFEVTNDGTLPHEFVVILTELAATELETTADGSEIDVEASGEVIGEIEEAELAVGATASATFHLEAGHYALICNVPGHHSAGMATDFEVTG